MARLLLGLVVVVVVATIYAVIDCAMLAHNRVRGLPKPVWLVVILVLPVVGIVLWFLIGRGRAAQVKTRQLPPDDNPQFFGSSAHRSDPTQDERIRRLEEELAALDSELDSETGNGSPAGSPKSDAAGTSQPRTSRPASNAAPSNPASAGSSPSSPSSSDSGSSDSGTSNPASSHSGSSSPASSGSGPAARESAADAGDDGTDAAASGDETATRGKPDDKPGSGRADV